MQTPRRVAPLVPYEPTPEGVASSSKPMSKSAESSAQNGEISSVTESSAAIGPKLPESSSVIGPQLPESSALIGRHRPGTGLLLDYDDSDDDNEVQSSVTPENQNKPKVRSL